MPVDMVAQSAPAVIVLVRHAERMPTGSDPGLLPAGHARATLLAAMLKDAGITGIFTSDALRTKQTAEPLATAIGKPAQELSSETSGAVKQIRAAGARVLVVGHSNTVPPLIAALGGPKDLKIADDEFDRFFVLTVPSTGAATLLALRYQIPTTP